MELSVWVEDEAGPYQTVPYPGESWQPGGQPVHLPHEYIRNGTAKMLTLFHPASGAVRVKGVTQSTNAILHPWIKQQVEEILKTLPEKPILDEETNRQAWKTWQHGLSVRITLPEELPPLRMLLIWDNLQGHYTLELVLWLFAHGVMSLYTPLGKTPVNRPFLDAPQMTLGVRFGSTQSIFGIPAASGMLAGGHGQLRARGLANLATVGHLPGHLLGKVRLQGDRRNTMLGVTGNDAYAASGSLTRLLGLVGSHLATVRP